MPQVLGIGAWLSFLVYVVGGSCGGTGLIPQVPSGLAGLPRSHAAGSQEWLIMFVVLFSARYPIFLEDEFSISVSNC